MLTTTQYQSLTGETAPASFSTLLPLVVSTLSRALGRHIQSAERTEFVDTYSDGIAYVSAIPVTDAGDLYTDGRAIWTGRRGRIGVTYTGGFAPFGTNVPHVLPHDLAMAIALGVKTMAANTAQSVPTGVASLSIAGEYSVTLAAGVVMGADGITCPASLSELAPLGGACARLAAPYRRL